MAEGPCGGRWLSPWWRWGWDEGLEGSGSRERRVGEVASEKMYTSGASPSDLSPPAPPHLPTVTIKPGWVH